MLSWNPPPRSLSLSARDVHVWKISLDSMAARLPKLAEALSQDERAEASLLRFERDRRRFIACRGILRAVLGRYLNAAADSIAFRYGPHGKPAVATGSVGLALRFNVSHAEGMALYGIANGREVGIDLERIHNDRAADEVAARFFSDGEIAALRALRPHERVKAFFRCWTRKEAYVKARGEGLSLPLTQFDVSLGPGEAAALLSTRHDPQDASRWSLRELLAGPTYVATIAVEGHGWQLRCWQWRR